MGYYYKSYCGNDYAYSVAVDSTGIYVVGSTILVGNYEWRIEKRNLNDGSLIWATTSNYGTTTSGDDEAMAVAVDSSGIYIAGTDRTTGNRYWRIEKRNKTDGSVIWAATSTYYFGLPLFNSSR
jgi:hypothetical protein